MNTSYLLNGGVGVQARLYAHGHQQDLQWRLFRALQAKHAGHEAGKESFKIGTHCPHVQAMPRHLPLIPLAVVCSWEKQCSYAIAPPHRVVGLGSIGLPRHMSFITQEHCLPV